MPLLLSLQEDISNNGGWRTIDGTPNEWTSAFDVFLSNRKANRNSKKEKKANQKKGETRNKIATKNDGEKTHTHTHKKKRRSKAC